MNHFYIALVVFLTMVLSACAVSFTTRKAVGYLRNRKYRKAAARRAGELHSAQLLGRLNT